MNLNPQLLLTSFCCLLFSATSLLAQGSVSGQVITEEGEAAEFVNVVLLAAADSSVTKLELSDETGSYQFKDVTAGDYLLKVMGLSFNDYLSDPFSLVNGQDKVLPVINLSVMATLLEEVEVVARKPFLEQRAGRLVVNVDQMITGQGGSVTDLLKKVPGLVVVNDRVSMAGRSGVTILIDGRPTKYMDIQSLLNEMPADNIARIEVVTQPGAAFDAEGTGGVINIILKRNVLFGTNGNITIGGGYGELAKYRAGINLNHRSGPWNLSLGTGYNRRTWIETLDLDRQVGDIRFVQESREPGLPHSGYLRLGADYDINDQHRVGVTANTYGSVNENVQSNVTEIISSEDIFIDGWTTKKYEDRSWRSYTTDVFYKWEIDTLGQQFSIDANFADYRRKSVSELITTGGDNLEEYNLEDRRNVMPADTRIYAAQADYKLPIGEYLQFQTGAKISATRLDNALRASLLKNGAWTNDPELTNTFDYSEDIYAAYTSMVYSKGEYEANVGIRYENSQALGYSATLDSTTTLDIAKFFPSVSVATPFFGPLGTSVSYSYRIERPGYFDLNPFRYFLDPLTSSRGNPFLRPELTHSGQFSLTYEKQPFFNLSYDYTKNVLTEVIEQDDESGEAFQTDINLDRYIKYGGSLFFPLDFIAKPISGYGGVMVFYHDYQSDYLGGEFLQNQWTTNAFLQVNVNLPGDWKFEATGWLQGAGIDGIIRHETFYGLDAGIQKKFFDNKLRVQVSADGIVQKFFEGNASYANLNMDVVSGWEAPVIRGRITYSFGNQDIKERERRRGASADERNRVNGN